MACLLLLSYSILCLPSTLLTVYRLVALAPEQRSLSFAANLCRVLRFLYSTDGNIVMAADGMEAASSSHHFMGVNKQDKTSIIHTRGNNHGYVGQDVEGIRNKEDGRNISTIHGNGFIHSGSGNVSYGDINF